MKICVYTYAHTSVGEFALARTVVNVEWVGLQYVSVISACSVAQCCGDSVRQHRGKKREKSTSVV